MSVYTDRIKKNEYVALISTHSSMKICMKILKKEYLRSGSKFPPKALKKIWNIYSQADIRLFHIPYVWYAEGA